MKKIVSAVVVFILMGGSLSDTHAKKADPDAIEDLISVEQQQLEEWLAQGEELPPAFLLGDKTGVQLYADHMETCDYEKLCESFDLDELLAAAQGDPGLPVVSIDVGIERVRDILGGACLVRPKDTLLAVGPGWQDGVTLKDFFLKKTGAVCRFDSSFSLWISFEEALPEPPLFFASGLENPMIGDNDFQPAVASSAGAVTEEEKFLLSKKINLIQEYSIVRYDLLSQNCEAVYHLKKKTVSLDDVGIPGEVLAWRKNEEFDILGLEIIEKTEGSGHIKLAGFFDFNKDGFADLWVEGDQKGCSYRLLFIGEERGFRPVRLPDKPCSC